MYKRAFFLILMQKKQHNLLFLDNFIKYRFMYNTCGLCSNLKYGRGMLHKERESW